MATPVVQRSDSTIEAVSQGYGCFKPRGTGHHIVRQELPTLLDVTCCVRFHTMWHVVALGVVAQSLKRVKRLATCKRTRQLPATRNNMPQGVETDATCKRFIWPQLFKRWTVLSSG